MEALLEIQPPPKHKKLNLEDLRDYQIDDINFLLETMRALCTNQPGMGKTIIAILAAIGNVLVVCPDYLKDQWEDVLKVQHPDHRIMVCNGQKMERMATILRANRLFEAPPKERIDTFNPDNESPHAELGYVHTTTAKPRIWLIVNKEMLRQYPIPPEMFDTMIIDESHHFRKQDTQQSKGALELTDVIPRVYMLTATPIVKDPDDLFMQLKLLDSAQFSSYWQFCHTYLVGHQTQYGYKIQGVRRSATEQLMKRYSTGHTYAEVKLQLPKLISQEIKFELPPDLRARYNMIRDFYRTEERTYANALAAMQALRQVTACVDKYETVVNLLEDLHDSKRKQSDSAIVIFTWYRNTAIQLAERLGAQLITGKDDAHIRPILGKSSPLTVCTLAAMSEGVDLSHARTVIFAEEYWTPGTQIQALARVRRWSEADNSEVPVLCYYVMANKTIDVTVHERLTHRKETLMSIVNSELDD